MDRQQSTLAEKRQRMDLGWLASSGTLPKKRKEIEGLNPTPILNLQAQVFEVQQRTLAGAQADGVGDGGVRRRALPDDLLGPANSGVSSRDQRDRSTLKSDAQRASDCYAALERKAALYEKLAQGNGNDDEEAYEVDFLRKVYVDGEGPPNRGAAQGSRHQQQQQPVDSMAAAVAGTGGLMSDDMRRELQRRAWEDGERQRPAEEDALYQEQRRRFKEDIRDIAEQTREERERAAELRRRSETAARTKQDKLKAAFLKKLGRGTKPA